MTNYFYSSNRNDSFSQLGREDLQLLLEMIQNFDLYYRDSLGLPNYCTFGYELEFENVSLKRTKDFVSSFLDDWDACYDNTLVFSGGEIKSDILTDDSACWAELKSACEFLRASNANTSMHAGGHFHVGAHILGSNSKHWDTYLKLYVCYEHILHRFFLGDKINERDFENIFATKSAKYIKEKILDIYEKRNSGYNILSLFPDIRKGNVYRCYALNLCNVNINEPHRFLEKNTVEYRAGNAFSNEIIGQNYVNTGIKLMLSSKDFNFDTEFLDYIYHNEYKYLEYKYNEVCLRDSLEFVDLVFDNNLDKVFFLRQYFKDFVDNYGIDGICKNAKKFYK